MGSGASPSQSQNLVHSVTVRKLSIAMNMWTFGSSFAVENSLGRSGLGSCVLAIIKQQY